MMDILAVIALVGLGLFIGYGITIILLWIRPEYGFLVFYVVANHVLVFLFSDVWRLTWASAPAYAIESIIRIATALVVGAPIVALFKWLKTRKTGSDKALDKEMERIRAEIAARDAQPPAAP